MSRVKVTRFSIDGVSQEYTSLAFDLAVNAKVLLEKKTAEGVDRRQVFNIERFQSKLDYLVDLIDTYTYGSNLKFNFDGSVWMLQDKVEEDEEGTFTKTTLHELVMNYINKMLSVSDNKWVIPREHDSFIEDLKHALFRLREITAQLKTI